jgi:hypothetical protein
MVEWLNEVISDGEAVRASDQPVWNSTIGGNTLESRILAEGICGQCQNFPPATRKLEVIGLSRSRTAVERGQWLVSFNAKATPSAQTSPIIHSCLMGGISLGRYITFPTLPTV